MELLKWSINDQLRLDTEGHYKSTFAMRLKDKAPLDVIRQLTFDGITPNITIQDIDGLLSFLESKVSQINFHGRGVEMGAGPLTFSSVLARRSKVSEIYGIEVCEPIIKDLAPRVVNYILPNQSHKVTGVLGDFDNVQFVDNSVDFIFEFFSLHHSSNITKTIKEWHRILKPGGVVVCLDKARPDFLTEKNLAELLDVEYNENFKKTFGINPKNKLTRRMNGENEYRLKDWKKAFKDAGFCNFYHVKVNKTVSRNILVRRTKEMISLLPISLQVKLTKFIKPRPKKNNFILSGENIIFSQIINPFAKECSLMVVKK